MRIKRIFFRVDASYKIGTGHVMRCLTLAQLFTNLGINSIFICRDLPGNLIKLIKTQGYKVYVLPCPKNAIAKNTENPYEDWLQVDWKTDAQQTVNIIMNEPTNSSLIVDHYSIDSKWEIEINCYIGIDINVIDDLANRRHFCTTILDQNLSSNEKRYDELVPKNCEKFLGTSYSILREEFLDEKVKLSVRDGKVRRILVFFGGSDPTIETLKTLSVLTKQIYSGIHIDIVVGYTNINKEVIRSFCEDLPNFHFHCQINNMAELMRLADLSIGAGGTTTWERCTLGLPTLTIITAENQSEIVNLVNNKGAIWNLGESSNVTTEIIEQELNFLLQNPSIVKTMSQKAIELMGENKLKRFIERVVDC